MVDYQSKIDNNVIIFPFGGSCGLIDAQTKPLSRSGTEPRGAPAEDDHGERDGLMTSMNAVRLNLRMLPFGRSDRIVIQIFFVSLVIVGLLTAIASSAAFAVREWLF